MKPSDLGLTIRELLRYAHGGLLAVLAAAIIDPAKTRALAESLGPALTALVALSVGIAIYAWYRPVIGLVVFWGLAETLHRRLAPRGGYDVQAKTGYTCRSHWLEERFKVRRSNTLNAYRVIRDSDLVDPVIRNTLHVQHSEISVLQVTCLILLVSGVISLFQRSAYDWAHLKMPFLFVIFGLLSGMFAIWGDIQICSNECAILMTLDEDVVGERLRRAHLGQTLASEASSARIGAA